MCLSLCLKKLRWLFKKNADPKGSRSLNLAFENSVTTETVGNALQFSLFAERKGKQDCGHLQSRLYENEQWGSLITQELGKQDLLDNWGFMSKMEMCKTREAWEHSSRLTYFYCDAPGLSTSSSL